MSLLLAMTGWHVEDWRARFQALLPEMPIVVPGEPFDRRAVHYVASWKHPAGSLTGLPNLAAIFSLGAGVDFLFADDKLPEVPIARVVDPDLTTRMSEYVVLHCLMYLRQQHRYMRQQQAKLWEDDRNQPAARSVRVGIMGLGELGLDAAAKLKLIGFDVAGWSRSPKSAEGLQTFSGEDGLKAFLPAALAHLLFGFWPAYAAVAGAMVGHAFPLPHPSRGGKSIMCFVGGAFALSPLAALGFAIAADFAQGAGAAVHRFQAGGLQDAHRPPQLLGGFVHLHSAGKLRDRGEEVGIVRRYADCDLIGRERCGKVAGAFQLGRLGQRIGDKRGFGRRDHRPIL